MPYPAFADSGDFMEGELTLNNPGFMERMLAGIVNNAAKGLALVLGLKDINALVFHSESRNLFGETHELIYDTFPKSVWQSIDMFYQSFSDVAYYLLFIGMLVFVLMYFFRAADSESHLTLRELVTGTAIFVVGMYLAGHLIKLFFDINNFFVAWGADVLKKLDYDPYTTSFISSLTSRMLAGDKYGLPSGDVLSSAIIFLVIVFVVAVLNYQYTIRILVMSVLIVLLPVVLFSSIFPASRRAFDIWVREFAVQAWLPGAHAIAFSLLYSIVSLREGTEINMIMMISMMFGILSVASLMRVILGAPGGKVSGSLGFGSVAAISMMLRNMRGGRVKATATATPVPGAGATNANLNPTLGKGMALGMAMSGISSPFVGAGNKMADFKSFGTSVLKGVVSSGAGLMAGIAATAMTGNMETGALATMRGYQIGKDLMSSQKGESEIKHPSNQETGMMLNGHSFGASWTPGTGTESVKREQDLQLANVSANRMYPRQIKRARDILSLANQTPGSPSAPGGMSYADGMSHKPVTNTPARGITSGTRQAGGMAHGLAFKEGQVPENIPHKSMRPAVQPQPVVDNTSTIPTNGTGVMRQAPSGGATSAQGTSGKGQVAGDVPQLHGGQTVSKSDTGVIRQTPQQAGGIARRQAPGIPRSPEPTETDRSPEKPQQSNPQKLLPQTQPFKVKPPGRDDK